MALEEFRVRFGKGMMELIGTGMLLMIVQLSVAGGVESAPLVIGLGLVALIYAGAPVSGSHYNPAVSLCFFLRGTVSFHQMMMYIVFQTVGGIAGALLGGIMIGKATDIAVGEGYTLLQALLAEFVFTALLCFVILGVVTNSKTEGNMYYAIAIGLVVYAGASTVGGVSGGAFNPSVAIGLTVVKHFWRFSYCMTVVLADILGAVAGTALYYVVAPDEFEHFGDEAHALASETRSMVEKARANYASTSA